MQERIDANPAESLDVIVTYESRPGMLQKDRVARLGGQVDRSLPTINAEAMRLSGDAVRELADHPDVAYVSLDHPVTGMMDVARGVAGLPDAFSQFSGLTGAGVTVAIIDSGVSGHADLGDRLLASVDFTGGFDAQDRWGHGTHVAGIIAGDGSLSGGNYRGVAPGASLVNLRVLDNAGRGTTSDVIAAVEWSIDHKDEYGIKVLNLSLGHPVFEPAANDPLVQAVEQAWEAGLVVVCSAGNNGSYGYFSVSSPGNSPRVITVASLTDWNTPGSSDDTVSSFSSHGPTAFDAVLKPDLIAPGNRIVSLRAPGSGIDVLHPEWRTTAPGAFGADYYELSGTSMAAGMVSATIALMIEDGSDPTPDGIKAQLMLSATDMQGLTVDVGAGVLDIEAALNETAWTDFAASPRMGTDIDGEIVVEDTADLWGDETWSNNAIWPDALLWSNAVLWSDPVLWSDAAAWSDTVLGADADLWSDTGLVSDGVISSESVVQPDELDGSEPPVQRPYKVTRRLANRS